nr:nucleotidyltransferase domain-containing protein [Novosphingobium panipatense]
MPEYLKEIRKETLARFNNLRLKLADAEDLIAEKACVYATGSFGRLEAGPSSDLDLFIVSETEEKEKHDKKVIERRLTGIDEICLKYHLVKAVDDSGIAPFDGSGKYLEVHEIDDFASKLGKREDDYHNTLTGRLLLLLESRPLLGLATYDSLLDNVIDAYFQDFKTNEDNFVPAFMVNDILRMWRTFAVNYELERRKPGNGFRIKNLKLKYSRMITCYSAVIYLLAQHIRAKTVKPEDVRVMVGLTPSERLEQVAANAIIPNEQEATRFTSLMADVLDDYSAFLKFTHGKKEEIEAEFDEKFAEWRENSYEFGRKFAEALTILGQSGDPLDGLYRIILI